MEEIEEKENEEGLGYDEIEEGKNYSWLVSKCFIARFHVKIGGSPAFRSCCK